MVSRGLLHLNFNINRNHQVPEVMLQRTVLRASSVSSVVERIESRTSMPSRCIASRQGSATYELKNFDGDIQRIGVDWSSAVTRLGIMYYLLRSVWHVLSWVRGLILLETPLRCHAFVVVPIHVGGLRVGYRDDHRLYLLFSVTPHSIIVLLVCQQAFF